MLRAALSIALFISPIICCLTCAKGGQIVDLRSVDKQGAVLTRKAQEGADAKQLKGLDNDQEQDEKQKKLKSLPEFKTFQTGKYLVVGTLKDYKAKGATLNGDKKTFFHRIEFQVDSQFRGNYLSAIEKERRDAGLKVTPKVVVSALLATNKADIAIDDESSDEACIFVLEPIKASAMEGTIPVRILAVKVATDEMLEIAKLASEENDKNDK